MTRDPRNFFTAEDFDDSGDGPLRKPAHEIANTLLAQYLEQCPRVFQLEHGGNQHWFVTNKRRDFGDAVMSARLIAIEPIGKEGG